MPTYEYQCEKCGPFEIWQSIKDDALSACPTCGGKPERLISANVGFVFKGSGFYQNEYKTQPKSSSVEPSKASGEAKASVDTKVSGEGKAADVAKAAQEKKPESKPSGVVKAVPEKPKDPAPVTTVKNN